MTSRRFFLIAGLTAVAPAPAPWPSFVDSAFAASDWPLIERRRKPLGFSAAPVPPGSKEALKLARDRGMIIVAVTNGSAADQAGLRKGDVLLAIDGRPVTNQADLDAALNAAAPAHQAVAEVSREGAIVAITIGF
jgi:S1-C subfamily serine protease